MDYLYQLALEPADNPLLPEGEGPDVVCRSVHNMNAEVAEHDNEVTVTLDTVPGAGNSTTSVDLIDENTLEITINRKDCTGDGTLNQLRERQSFSLHHVIPLPCRVIPRGAQLSMRNGVLDIRLKKGRFQQQGTC
jgi:HSP20 family molecular chaperone IbpA